MVRVRVWFRCHSSVRLGYMYQPLMFTAPALASYRPEVRKQLRSLGFTDPVRVKVHMRICRKSLAVSSEVST